MSEVGVMQMDKNGDYRGTWRAQSVECGTLNLGVVNSSPVLGVEVT